jgi:hypothetical protein
MLTFCNHPVSLCSSVLVLGLPPVLLLLPPPVLLRVGHPSLELIPSGTPSRRREEAVETAAHLMLPVDIEDVVVGGVDDAGAADAGRRLSEVGSGST